jgi:hypothetical protein
MKTSILLTLGAVAFAAITINATAADVLLTPRAAGNQIKTFAGIYNDPNLVSVDHYTVVISPRANGNQLTTSRGTNDDVNPAAICAKSMNGTPKMVAECTSHTTMQGCSSVSVAEK